MGDEALPGSPGAGDPGARGQHDSDDARLIAESRDDPERFAVLFDRHAPEVHQYIARRLGPSVADDLVAETFTVAFRKRGSYRAVYADARPWLYGIATRLVQQHRRSEARKYRALARTGVDPAIENHAEDVVTDVSARALRQKLGGALARIPPGSGTRCCCTSGRS